MKKKMGRMEKIEQDLTRIGSIITFIRLSRFSNECTVGFPTCREFHSVEILGRLENLPYMQMKSDLNPENPASSFPWLSLLIAGTG